MTTNNSRRTATRNDLATTTPWTEASLVRRVALAVATAAVAASILLGGAGTELGASTVDFVRESSNTLAIVDAWPAKYCGCQ